MFRTFLLPLCCVIAAICSGCATQSRIPLELQYSPPRAGAGVASLKGSQTPSTFFDNFTAFVLSIDGKRVMAERKGWNTPIAVTPGHHTVTVEFRRGDYSARTEIDLNAVHGASYEVKFATDVKLYGSNSYVDFWIADISTGKPVTGLKRAAVNLANAGGTIVPIPIVVPKR